jgi:hypothetical protein
MNGRHLRSAAAALLLATSLAAQAGRSCENKPPNAGSVQRALGLAEHTAAALDASGAEVVMLARVGQNLSDYGLRYSHLAFAYREGKTWRVMHKLNQCGTAHAALFRQGLGEFFLDDLYDFEAGLVVLAPALQAQLLPLLRDNARVAQLNHPAYNMLAYPWASTYQQSNQWAIETLAMAADASVSNRAQAQRWLQQKDYQPTTLKISAMKRLGARVTAANIAFDDHPSAKRFSDRIETVTVDSVFSWLGRSGLGDTAQVVR